MSRSYDPRVAHAAVALALLAVLGPFLSGDGVDVPDDALYYALPSWEWMRHAAWSGTSPWWVPGKLGGVSLFADVVPMGPFHPAMLAAIALPSLPGLILVTVLHVLGAFAATRWAARVFGASAPSATLASLAVVVGPVGASAMIDAQMDAWPAFVSFPIVLGALHRAADAEGVVRARLLAVAGAAVALLLLGTHLRIAAAAGAALALWALIRGRDLRGALLAGGLGLVAGAPGYIPMLLELGEAGARPSGLPVDQALGLGNLAGWLAPTPRVLVRDLSVGPLLGAAFALGALRVVDVPRRLLLWTLLLLGAGASAIPGFRWVFAPLRVLSAPVDIVYAALAMFPAAIVGAIALDRLADVPAAAWSRRLGTVARVLLALLAGSVVMRPALRMFTDHPAATTAAFSALQAAVVIGLAAIVVVRVDEGRRRVGLLLLVGALDLTGFAVRAHLAVPSTPLRSPLASAAPAELLENGYLDITDLARGFDSALNAAGGTENRTDVEWDVRLPESDAPAMQADLLERGVPPHHGVAVGVRGLAGRSKLPPARAVAGLTPLADQLQTVDGDPDVLHALFATPEALGSRTLALHGIPTAIWSTDIAFRVTSPDCTSPARWEVVEDPAERVRRALTETDVGFLESPRNLPEGTVSCARDGDGWTVESEVPAAVVLPARVHRGRELWANGARIEHFAVNEVQMGTVVPAGFTELTLRFRPPGLRGAVLAALFGWLAILGLLAAPLRRIGAVALVTLAFTTPASAAELSGSVAPQQQDTNYRVLVVDSLDLSRPALADVAVAEDGTWSATYQAPGGDTWAFLRQETVTPRGPLVHFVPYDLAPLQEKHQHRSLRFRALPRAPILARAGIGSLPGWWSGPLLLILLVYGGGLLGLALLGAAPSGGSGGPGRRSGAPRAGMAHTPYLPGEHLGLWSVMAAAALTRAPRLLFGPLELIEHTYGPGSRRVVPVDASGLSTTPWTESLLQAVLEPSSLEVTHPPLWHLLLAAIGVVTDAEWALRLPSYAASLATVYLLHILFRRLDPYVGLMAAGLYALSATGVHPGGDATPYAFVALVSVGSIELLLRALERGTKRAWRLWVGVLVVGFLTHYTVAILGAAQIGALAVFVGRRRTDPHWSEAGRRAIRAGMLISPPALAWSFLHFASFAAVAVDTRLFATVYPPDPGRWTFLGEFAAVTAGSDPLDGPGIAMVAFLLAALGVGSALRKDPQLGSLLVGAAAAWAGGTFFFHQNLVEHLDGRVFYGFRWVSWYAPLLLGTGAAGLAAGFRAGTTGRLLVVFAGLIWAAGAFRLSLGADASPRPAYDEVAEFIRAELQDRDAVAVLPLWGQQGPLTHYLTQKDGVLIEDASGPAWRIDGKRLFLEAIEESLPFETSADNHHFDRLWVAVVDERMFGRPKFLADAAERSIAWADASLLPDGTWSFDHLKLLRYRLPAASNAPLVVDPRSPSSARFLAPNQPTCTDLGLEDGEPPRWTLHVRARRPGRGEVVRGRLTREKSSSMAWTGVVEGGDCVSEPPVLTLSK